MEHLVLHSLSQRLEDTNINRVLIAINCPYLQSTVRESNLAAAGDRSFNLKFEFALMKAKHFQELHGFLRTQDEVGRIRGQDYWSHAHS